ncbi:hypothetical protein PALB_1320 [Pseudoalteromonas luteoviolacea B = ATCC 29581]|nr:hypothetical protein PALB_1320 [Pseudoalteromonas luteoviolacea B = ATCC 29581]
MRYKNAKIWIQERDSHSTKRDLMTIMYGDFGHLITITFENGTKKNYFGFQNWLEEEIKPCFDARDFEPLKFALREGYWKEIEKYPIGKELIETLIGERSRPRGAPKKSPQELERQALKIHYWVNYFIGYGYPISTSIESQKAGENAFNEASKKVKWLKVDGRLGEKTVRDIYYNPPKKLVSLGKFASIQWQLEGVNARLQEFAIKYPNHSKDELVKYAVEFYSGLTSKHPSLNLNMWSDDMEELFYGLLDDSHF